LCHLELSLDIHMGIRGHDQKGAHQIGKFRHLADLGRAAPGGHYLFFLVPPG